MLSRIVGLCLVLPLLACLRLSAAAATQDVTLEQLGLPGDRTVYGARPSLTFYLPVYPSVRAVRFHARVRLSPALDPHSTITIVSGGTPVMTTNVNALRKHPVVDVALPLPEAPQHMLDVSIEGGFAHVGDDECSRFDPSSLYMIVERGASFAVDTQRSSTTISDFLETYSGDVAIVVPPGSDMQRKRAAVRLGYEVQQLYRWRQARVVLRTSPSPSMRNIVLGDFSTDIAAEDGVLRVGPKGVALLDREIDPLLITTAVDAADIEPSATPAPGQHVSLRDLGVVTETANGTHPVFSLPFSIGRAGGIPNGLRFDAVVAHTALGPVLRGDINLFVNGALVDSVPLDTMHGRQDVEFAIASREIAASNDVRLTVDYDTARDCRLPPPSITTTLFDDSTFRWDNATAYTYSVGDFFRAASGRVAVMLDDERLVPYAFSLLAAIGDGNANISSLDVLPVSDRMPKGYDAVIVVAPLERLAGWKLPLSAQGDRFVLSSGGTHVLDARYNDSFGVLESARIDNVPVLVASFWKDAAATAGLDRLGYATLGTQTDRVFLFRGTTPLYASTGPVRRDLPQPFLLRSAIPIYIGCAGLLGIVVLAARRKRRGGKAA